MQKDNLSITLFELETLIKPGKVEEVLLEFGKELLRRFDLECFVAEVPMLRLRVEIPEGCGGCSFTFEGSAVKFRICGDVEGLEKPISDLMERLDQVIQHSVYYEFWVNLLEKSPDAVVVVDEHGNVIKCNRKAMEIFGEIEKLPEISGSVWEYRGRFYSVAEYSLGAVRSVILRDITEVKELESAAGESEERFRALAEAVPVAVMAYHDGKWIFVNRSAEELTGYTKEEILSGKFWELFPKDEREKISEKMRKRLAGEPLEPYKVRIRRKDGEERVAQVYGTRVVWRGKIGGLVALVDVTAEEREKKRLEDLTRILELINKILRHDVMNALASAAAFIDIYDETKDEAMLKKAKEAIDRAVMVVRNMREFESVVKEEGLKVVNVREMAERAAKGFGIPINIEGDCEVLADDGLVAVFENLYQNAVQHGETERVDVKIRKAGKHCEIRVADYGKGIPDEIKGKVFEEGFKYGPKASTGFGLYAVKRLVERYGGEVRVEDNEPCGVVFVIRLMRV